MLYYGFWVVNVVYSGFGVFLFWMVSVLFMVLNVDIGIEICC